MNEEEMIKIIKYHSCYDISEEDKKTKSWEYIDISGDEFHEFRNALIQLLDLYNQEKEKNKELVKVIKNVREMHDVKCKVIDMMAEEILKITKANDISNYLKQFSNYDIDFVKQYYFKKARGEEDVKD